MPDQDKSKLHVMSEADKARNAAKEAKAGERDRLLSDVVNQSALALDALAPEGRCFHHHCLESFVTSEKIATRSGIEFTNPFTFLFNGNNITLTRDMTERVIWCNMWSADPSRRKPRIKNFALHHQENWPDYFNDLVTIIFAWLNAGRPKMERETILNKYGHWERTIGGLLSLCGVTDFLPTQVEKTKLSGL